MHLNGIRGRLLRELARRGPATTGKSPWGGPSLTIEQLERQARKEAKISNELRFGLPHLTTTRERIDRLVDRDFCAVRPKSDEAAKQRVYNPQAHQELMWTVSETRRKQMPDYVTKFADKVTWHLAKEHGIPVYCEEMSYGAHINPFGMVRILHCHYGMELRVEDWKVLGDIIKNAVGLSCNAFSEWKGERRVHWCGDDDFSEYRPDWWELTGFDEFIGEKR